MIALYYICLILLTSFLIWKVCLWYCLCHIVCTENFLIGCQEIRNKANTVAIQEKNHHTHTPKDWLNTLSENQGLICFSFSANCRKGWQKFCRLVTAHGELNARPFWLIFHSIKHFSKEIIRICTNSCNVQ